MEQWAIVPLPRLMTDIFGPEQSHEFLEYEFNF